MAVEIVNIWGTRTLRVEGGTNQLPDSVFLSCKQEFGEFCMELPRDEFLSAIKREFDLAELGIDWAERLLAG